MTFSEDSDEQPDNGVQAPEASEAPEIPPPPAEDDDIEDDEPQPRTVRRRPFTSRLLRS